MHAADEMSETDPVLSGDLSNFVPVESSWLWLNEADLLIAGRLAKRYPERFAQLSAALSSARDQLLDQAYRGAVEIQGKWFAPEEQPSHDISWSSVDPAYWNPAYRSKENENADWVASVTIHWDSNSFVFENIEIDNCGFEELKVRREDLDRLWPSTYTANSRPSARNPGGRPLKFDWVEFLIEVISVANTPDGLPDKSDKHELASRMLDWCHQVWGDNAPSQTSVDNLIRRIYDHPGIGKSN